MAISNSTGKNKEFYELGKKMFDQIKPFKPVKPYVDPIKKDVDLLYSALIADNEALEDAKITFDVIKKVDPGVYDEIIDSSLALINKALKISYSDALERIEIRLKRTL